MTNLKVLVVPVTQYVQNCMILVPDGSTDAVVIDPGGDLERITGALDERSLRVAGILVTHGHIDHIGALDLLADAAGAPVWYHRDDLFLYGMRMPGRTTPIRLPDGATAVDEGDVVEVAGLRFEVLHTPGHSPGSVSFLRGNLLFSGDVLFNGSIGRTDLPQASFDVLEESIHAKLWPLPDDTRVLPGHGPPTTIGVEKQHNPFVGVHTAGPGTRR